jgi:hypothetical protein
LIVATFGGLILMRYINGSNDFKFRKLSNFSYNVLFFILGSYLLLTSLNALYLILDICKTEYTDKCRRGRRGWGESYDCQKCDDWDIIIYEK